MISKLSSLYDFDDTDPSMKKHTQNNKEYIYFLENLYSDIKSDFQFEGSQNGDGQSHINRSSSEEVRNNQRSLLKSAGYEQKKSKVVSHSQDLSNTLPIVEPPCVTRTFSERSVSVYDFSSPEVPLVLGPALGQLPSCLENADRGNSAATANIPSSEALEETQDSLIVGIEEQLQSLSINTGTLYIVTGTQYFMCN